MRPGTHLRRDTNLRMSSKWRNQEKYCSCLHMKSFKIAAAIWTPHLIAALALNNKGVSRSRVKGLE